MGLLTLILRRIVVGLCFVGSEFRKTNLLDAQVLANMLVFLQKIIQK